MRADELTYVFHIIIRYEIEKMLVEGTLGVADIPKVWNEKYKEYLGIDVSSDKDGVLQDSHLSSGFIGYFIIYLTGSAMDIMLANEMEKEFPVKEAIASGDISRIRGWLREHICRFGYSKDPYEILIQACNGAIDGSSYVQYLTKKYSEIYNL